MFNWIKSLFTGRRKKLELTEPKIGEVWELILSFKGPLELRVEVTIRDVRDGLVLYYLGPGPFRLERMPVEKFVCLYRLSRDTA